jgi:hypothetical protein
LIRAFGDPEVEQLHERLAVAVVAQEDVLGLDVAVDDAALVRARERLRHVRDDERGVRGRDAPPLHQELAQIAPLEQLHHDVGLALGRHAVVEHLHHVRAAEVRRRVRLLGEPLDVLAVVEQVERQELHDDGGAEREMVRDPHPTHPAHPQLADETDGRAHQVARTMRRQSPAIVARG